MTKQTWEDGDTVTYQYDNTGALATVTDSATGHTTTYYYDFTDRLMKYVESGEGYSHSVGYAYDDLNNLTTLIENINNAFLVTEYAYDDSYRVTSISSTLLGVGPNIFCPVKEFTYDGYNRVNDWKIMSNGTALLTETFAYRDFPEGSENPTSTSGQIDNLTISSAGLNRQYFYEYDGNGNITSVETKDKNASGQYESTGETTYVYDTAGQLLWEYNGEAQTAWNWTYDNAGNILSRREYAYIEGTLGDVLATVTYGYDNANWGDVLTSYDGKNITYDAIGNPLNDGTWAYTWEHGRQLASMNTETVTLDYEYNSDGLRTRKTVTTLSDHVHSFQDTVHQPKCTENGYTTHTCICGYIYQDSPVPATGHDFTTTVVGTNCTEVGHTVYTCECGYSYEDGSNGHTFTTLVVEPSETVNGLTLHECECGYSYESDPVASLAGTNGSDDVVSDVKVYDYVYNGSSLTKLTITTTITGDGTSTEELYFAYDGSSPMSVTYNGDTFYYVTNLQGDVIAILNDQGVAVVTYTYDAWGNILATSGTMASTLGVANPLTYRGYVYDAESKLYYLQSRYYNPEVGRFINADTLVATGQGFIGNNMFTYCLNNPVVFTDSLGMAAAVAKNISMVWNATMWWLCLVDAFLPFGDAIYVSVAIAIPIICTLTLTSTQAEEKADTKAEVEVVTTGGGSGRDYSVYFLYQRGDPSKTIIYVGRVKTANFRSRMSYHAKKGRMLAAHIDGLTYEECRAIEQAGMLYHHTIGKGVALKNQINGIYPSNSNAPQYWQSALDLINSGRYPLFNFLPSSYLSNQAENELLNMGM